MSKYILVTGLENNAESCRKKLAKAMNQVHEMSDIGDDDNDKQVYIVYTSENHIIMGVVDQYAKDHSLKTVALMPEFEVAPSTSTLPDYVRRFKGTNKMKVTFENSDLVITIGEPSEYSRAAGMYGCRNLQIKDD